MFGLLNSTPFETEVTDIANAMSELNPTLKEELDQKFGIDVMHTTTNYCMKVRSWKLQLNGLITFNIPVMVVLTACILLSMRESSQEIGVMLKSGYLPIQYPVLLALFFWWLPRTYRDFVVARKELKELELLQPYRKFLDWVKGASQGLGGISTKELLSRDLATLQRDARMRLVNLARTTVATENQSRKQMYDIDSHTSDSIRALASYDIAYHDLYCADLVSEHSHLAILEECRRKPIRDRKIGLNKKPEQ